MAKHKLGRVTDDEGITHFVGAGQCVNIGLCGFNGDVEVEDAADPVDCIGCIGCIAQIEHIYSHQKPGQGEIA